jgi:ribosomal-protein-alanine N-acetyltransferase
VSATFDERPSAMQRRSVVTRPMTTTSLDAVVRIEQAVYPFPWSRGNFVDSIAAGHLARVLEGGDAAGEGELVGYLVAMAGFEEMHLLNVSVAPSAQGRGLGRLMLDQLIAHCSATGAHRLWLEVRPSNVGARAVYEHLGFEAVGIRKNYYPAARGQREDAIVMSLEITAAGRAPREGAEHGLD